MSIEWVVGGKASRAVHLDLARRATAQFPRSAAAWYALAENHARDDDFADVVAATARAIALAPPTGAQLATYARALIALDRPAEALEALERYSPTPPGPRFRGVRGEALRRLGRLAEARADFDAALAADPRDVTAGRGLALMLTHQGRWQDLLDVIAAIEADGVLSMALLVAKERALRGTGRHAQARALLDFERLGQVRTIAAPEGFAGLRRFNAALASELAAPSLQRLSDRPRLRLVGGTQVEGLLGSDGPALQALFATIRAAVDDYFAGVDAAPRRAELRPWALVLGPDDYQARHYHVEAALAGVYYVAAPAAAMNEAAADGALVIPDLPADLEGGEGLVRHIAPRPGRLVLFPGYLPHRTLPMRKPGQRISIAFNVVSREGRD